MCGRFTQQRPTSELAEIFEATDLAGDPGGRYNVAPTDEAAVVVQRDERRAIVQYRWGLIPHWSDGPKIAARTFNARAETVAVLPAFRDSLRRRRCLVPIDSFYEWRRDGSARRPYRIALCDGRPLVVAGLWSGWRDPATETIRRTFTIVTKPATEQIAELHDRMPAILPAAAWAAWLDVAGTDPGELQALLGATDSERFEIHPVAPLVNNVRNDGPELVAPLA